MKIRITIPVFILALIVFGPVSLAQITITSADASAINTVGNMLTNHIDSLTTSVNIGSPGETSWDFSALNSQFANTFTCVVPASTPYISDFPSANVVFSYDEIIDTSIANGWQYTTQNSGDYMMNGVVIQTAFGNDIFLIKAIYSPAQVFFPLPYTYNSQWNSSFTITNTRYFNGAPFGSPTIANHTENVVVDAWGNMTMPGGAVSQALRVRRDDRYTSPTFPFYKRVISYSFITKSGTTVEVSAIDTTAPNSGIIGTDGVAWRNVGPVGVENEDQIPTEYSLSQNYPNPFNPSTIISFSIPKEEFVSLKVFNSLGEEVAEIISETKPTGNYSVTFDAS
ncbi:MAG: hypothetical protein Q8M94_03500, partial [Ignavibacteria bacterium]|nr:hypothetical protein [Ignavibacteria bacterium]